MHEEFLSINNEVLELINSKDNQLVEMADLILKLHPEIKEHLSRDE